jgi:hypothetical protein
MAVPVVRADMVALLPALVALVWTGLVVLVAMEATVATVAMAPMATHLAETVVMARQTAWAARVGALVPMLLRLDLTAWQVTAEMVVTRALVRPVRLCKVE